MGAGYTYLQYCSIHVSSGWAPHWLGLGEFFTRSGHTHDTAVYVQVKAVVCFLRFFVYWSIIFRWFFFSASACCDSGSACAHFCRRRPRQYKWKSQSCFFRTDTATSKERKMSYMSNVKRMLGSTRVLSLDCGRSGRSSSPQVKYVTQPSACCVSAAACLLCAYKAEIVCCVHQRTQNTHIRKKDGRLSVGLSSRRIVSTNRPTGKPGCHHCNACCVLCISKTEVIIFQR